MSYGDPLCCRIISKRFCGRRRSEHIGMDQVCPDAPPGRVQLTFRGHSKVLTRASTSLTESDAVALQELVRRELRSGSPWARSNAAALGRLGGAAQSLLRRIAAQRGGEASEAEAENEAAQ